MLTSVYYGSCRGPANLAGIKLYYLRMEQDMLARHSPMYATQLTVVCDQPVVDSGSRHSPAAESALPAVK